MSTNPPNLRPDLAPQAKISNPARPGQPTIGMVSLGCPKNTVDSERMIGLLQGNAYEMTDDLTISRVEIEVLADLDAVERAWSLVDIEPTP